jgi:serine/threonine-protein kinase
MSLVHRAVNPQRHPGEGGLGSVPADTEGERGLLQTRLALFGRVGTVISLGFYVLVNLIVQLGPGGTPHLWLGSAVNRWHLVATALLALVWAVSRSGHRPRWLLEAVDAATTVGVGVVFALMGTSAHWRGDPTLPMLLAASHAVGIRAVLIPSSTRRTAVIHTLALAPVVASAYAIHRAGLAGQPHWHAVYDAHYTGLWCAVALVVSTLTSHVIYGLSQRVRDARKLGQYVLEEKIGEGGMGTVYRARHGMLRRATAIKLLHPDRSGQRDLARFEREVRLTSRLTHPNTIAIYDYGRTPEGIFYYAMELLDGIDLEGLVRRFGPQPPERVIHILRQVAGALGEAHHVGLIHRDVKPANIILCNRGFIPDVAKVVDFGLVKAAVPSKGDAALTAVNTITGTPHYMPPEAVQSPDRVDARSDLYSLGAVGYYLLSGRTVFTGDNVVAVLADHLHTPPVPPSRHLDRPLPGDLEAVLLRCLAKDPADRPASADELDAALAACADAGAWTAAAARAWWSAHPKALRAPHDGAPAAPAMVTIAMEGRAEASA